MYNNVQQFDTSNSFALHNLWLQYNMQMVVKKEEMYWPWSTWSTWCQKLSDKYIFIIECNDVQLELSELGISYTSFFAIQSGSGNFSTIY